jgi:hypothetical protein
VRVRDLAARLNVEPDGSPAGGVLVDGDAPRPNLLASE